MAFNLKIPLLGCLVFSLLILSGCVTSQDDFNRLQGQVATNGQRLDRLHQEVDSLQDKIDPLHSSQADLAADLKALQVELAKVRGQTDELGHRLEGLETEVQSGLESTEAQAQVQTKGSNATLGQDQAPVESSQASESAQEFASAKAMYDAALKEFKKRNYGQAQTLWARFIEDNPGHELVPNAYFWQGESYYQDQDYARAVLSYQEVIERFKDSQKFRPALLKQGLSFYKLDKDKPGRVLLQRVIDSYPNSKEAKRAKEFLN